MEKKVIYYHKGKQVEALNIGDKCPTCQAVPYLAGRNNRMVHYMSGLVCCETCGTVIRTVESVIKWDKKEGI